MTTAIYAGSFDPFTIGHLSVIREATNIFDKTIVALAENSFKNRRIDSSLMFNAMNQVIKGCRFDNQVIVRRFQGLIADLAIEEGTAYLIRGIRNGMDYEYEESIAKVNESLGLKTIYIRAGYLSHVSSSMVMELYKYGRDISAYVPLPVLQAIKDSNSIKLRTFQVL
ncbi:phosphopantetheine adenylyltransferase [Oxobacter pfennigii]|uniref:Phosphopantetheine adenylyltransferase n=1 Tax=Oxobacter pfennigii TaxID=36849 RepID=A0A0P9ACD1_9CLOT|nr:pantetheine-phosphate adenylyltransferase [Oxobacter pfennigii]KPU42757.1 phosphopantetheine adenylyltransferase [Oxobacter pfennigii]